MEPLWSPSAERIASAQITRLAADIGAAHGVTLENYTELHAFSVERPADFWRQVWLTTGVLGQMGERVIEQGDRFHQTRFFPDASLNVAQNLLRRSGDGPAMIWRAEDKVQAEISWQELEQLVSQLQQALTSAGVHAGDRVAAWLPNRPETYALMLAAASLGAVFTSTSPDFGSAGVVDRFGQTTPKVLVVTDGYWYGGKWFDRSAAVREVLPQLPSVEQVWVLPYQPDAQAPNVLPVATARHWSDVVASHKPQPVSFVQLPFDHPWYVLYSSGTTGKPKCIVHRCGGVLLKHLVEHQMHCDVQPGDRVFYFTTAGWMMWNWLASGLASEATIVLYDGSPFHPTGVRLFDLVDELDISLLGVSAKFIDSLNKGGFRPAETHNLGSLRTICSTGSPLVAEGFDYVYNHVKADVHLASISGGTDLCGCLVAGDPTGPVFAGEIQRPALGLDIDVVDELGNSVPPGEQGELVCRSPFPSMPIRFWDDPNDERYQAAYFERFPGMWHQGDFAETTLNGGSIIHGRSDATLNPGGVRIGTAEIYRIVDALPEVQESLVIGQRWEGDTRVVLFVVTTGGAFLTDEMQATIRAQIKALATPRHVPARIAQVPDLPRTRSGKITELAVREVVHGRDVKNREALANPEVLDHFANREELQE